MSDLISRDAAIREMYRLEREDIEAYGAKIQEGFDAEPAVEALRALPASWQEEFEWCTGCKEYDQKAHCCHRFTKVILDTVEEVKDEIPRWIPCDERLPKTNPVLVSDYVLVSVAWWNGYWFESATRLPIFNPKAWMPLPKPYKELPEPYKEEDDG